MLSQNPFVLELPSLEISYRVHRLRCPDGSMSVTLLGPEGVVESVDRMVYSAQQFANCSLHSLLALCYDLKHWFTFLREHHLLWNRVTWNRDEVMARFVAWLRYGDALSLKHRVIPLHPKPIRQETTLARILSSLYAFYEFHLDTPFAESVRRYQATRRGHLKRQILSHPKGLPRPVVVRPPGRTHSPEVLSSDEVQAIKAACLTYRDQLLISLMADRGMRVGAALGLRHSDWDSRKAVVSIVPRLDNANGALAKTDRVWHLPLRQDVLDLHASYLYDEYLNIDSDYLFVNLKGRHRAEPMSAGGVRAVIQGLIKRSGVSFHPHLLRHTFATEAIARGVPLGVVQAMLMHKSAATTSSIYVHLSAEQVRRWLDPQAIPPLLSRGEWVDLTDPEALRARLEGDVMEVRSRRLG